MAKSAEGTASRPSRRVTPRQIAALVVAVLIVIFIVQNRELVRIQLFTASVTSPLWLVLAVMIVLGALIGFTLGRRRR